MKRTLLLLITLLFFENICFGQIGTSKNEVFNKEFNWHITIPNNFKSLSADDYTKLQQKGVNAMEKTTDSKIENNSTPIFAFRADQLHYFESNSQPFDTIKDGNYAEVSKEVYNILFETFKQQMPSAKLDSSLSTEIIDKLTFIRLNILITLPNKVVINMLMYNRLFDKKELTVTMMFVDKDKGDMLLNAWRNSRFE
ncbi:hypothetical protein [Mucilaginibacter sp.]|uniref:hypothetical protein n=1 Tax=Mucilaginibacter sp. TaxID=1882438 RepID=UPI0026162E20|nr:hypothetical protein [Mucilaginibacter sp.]MDB4921352.1 hypothetical protein [Mucilaginibacter sp.]